jgi:hypothetical protein
MNNKFIKILSVGLTLVMLLSASKPTIDGRAVVADEGELPVGLFAKSANYMPGDTVIVTNPSAKVSIEVMIFGSFDSSEGIAIILSPEAAKNLYIAKGSNSIVQVTKARTRYNEKTVLSSTLDKYDAVIDPDKNPSAYIDDSIPYVEEDVVAEVTPVETVAETAVEEITLVEEVLPIEPIAEESIEEVSTLEPVVEELPVETVPEILDEKSVIATDTPILEPEEPITENIQNIEELPAVEKTETEEILDLEKLKSDLLNKSIEDSVATIEEIPAVEEIAEEPVMITEITEEVVPEVAETVDQPLMIEEPLTIVDTSSNPVEIESPIMEETKDEVAVVPEEVPEEIPENEEDIEETIEIVEVVEVPEEVVEQEEILETAEPEVVFDEIIPEVEETNEYVMAEPEVYLVPNVLVPTDSNPPPVIDEPEVLLLTPYPDVTEEMNEIDDPMAFLPAVEETVEQEPVIPVPVTKTTENKSMVSIFDYVIKSEKEIGTGSYYIQLATYKLEENIIKLISTYGNKYPIKLLRSDTIEGYKVVVGPLNGDEYPVVLQRFISYGYKDAFIRLVK